MTLKVHVLSLLLVFWDVYLLQSILYYIIFYLLLSKFTTQTYSPMTWLQWIFSSNFSCVMWNSCNWLSVRISENCCCFLVLITLYLSIGMFWNGIFYNSNMKRVYLLFVLHILKGICDSPKNQSRKTDDDLISIVFVFPGFNWSLLGNWHLRFRPFQLISTI